MKRFFSILALVIASCMSLHGQDNGIPYIIVEQKPTFNGGDAQQFSKWVNSQIIYPEDAKASGAHGRVIVQFTVEPDGSLSNVNVLKSSGTPSLDAEAVRVVSSSPKWEPGRQEDKAVRVVYSFPIVFRINLPKPQPAADEEAIPFQLVEEKPSFMGGDANTFSKWVNSNLKYPEDAKAAGVSGRVVLQFSIMPDGSVADVRVLRSSGNNSLDAEGVRVLSSSPKWKPGIQKGSPVKVTYTFPVIFGLR